MYRGKRAFDLVLVIVSSPLWLPALAIIALLVRLQLGAPVMFRQVRPGRNGRPFELVKFRTMSDRRGPDGTLLPDAQRLGQFGRRLRSTSLDELPEMLNVLRGEMSLVGPRPERPVFVEDFRRRIPGYMLRHKVKAGMTGWAQVNGWRGDTSLEKRIEYDLYYIERWSLFFDVKILLRTFYRGFTNAY